ncbi:hypothetical protein GCM10011380_31450 [Sphingomonas metalli]|uniref:Uncharacterized protein n=1 Tax=Sphingomonas metalli TaxID=1779358 RepID=A0A916WWK0_9SPHN|nr:hypothetical protein [Sphingomonas metalli]GGB39646.1 hypothetical protein GCM10011380_31450 [Sphingomonas metalli]
MLEGRRHDTTVDAATISQGASFLTSAHWIARVLDPNRPKPAQIVEWAEAIRSAAEQTDLRMAARMARPRSLLAQRLAEHLAAIMSPQTDADALAGKAQVAPGAPLLELTLALADQAGIRVDYPATLLLPVWDNLENTLGGRKAAYAEYRRALDALVTDVDRADTEARIREARLAAHRRAAA